MGPRTLVAGPDERVSGTTSFGAIDRPLTDRQMRELRAISTRAAISRTSFSNHYEYGDLKADRRVLLVKYFDASLYFAHWLYLEVAFRFPKSAIDVKALRRYAGGHAFDVRMMAKMCHRRHLGRKRWSDLRCC